MIKFTVEIYDGGAEPISSWDYIYFWNAYKRFTKYVHDCPSLFAVFSVTMDSTVENECINRADGHWAEIMDGTWSAVIATSSEPIVGNDTIFLGSGEYLVGNDTIFLGSDEYPNHYYTMFFTIHEVWLNDNFVVQEHKRSYLGLEKALEDLLNACATKENGHDDCFMTCDIMEYYGYYGGNTVYSNRIEKCF